MITFTPLEREVLSKILVDCLGDPLKASKVLSALVPADRSFSPDIVREGNCCGFYLNFEANTLLAETSFTAGELSIQGNNASLSLGGDFLLFPDTNGGVKFLEATFFGESVPINSLLAERHGFAFT